MRIIYVFSSDLYVPFHVNYGKFFPVSNLRAFWVMGAVKFFCVYVQCLGKSRTCSKGSFCINILFFVSCHAKSISTS